MTRRLDGRPERTGPLVELGPGSSGPIHRVRVALVVDDEVAIRRLVATILRRNAFSAFEAADGRSALDALRGNIDVLDLVVTDYHLPDMNGVQLAALVREARPEAAVVLMTADPSLLDPALAYPLLEKPFTLEALLSAIAAARRSRR